MREKHAPTEFPYAWMAQRHMQLYGTTHEQLGAVAVAMRKHAQLHPNVLMKRAPITLDDYLASRWVSYPYVYWTVAWRLTVPWLY